MRIDKLTVGVRPRAFWEAMDLGLVMTRNWWKAVYGPWLIVITLVWGLLSVIFRNNPVWALLIFWWTKPLWARMPLFVLSRAMFGDTPSLGRCLREFPRQLLYPFIGRMTIYRFGPNRAALEPALLLEGQTGKQRAQRLRLLAGQLTGQSVNLGLFFMVFEWLVIFPSFWALAWLIVPQGMDVFLEGNPATVEGMFTWSCLYFLTVAILEPFHVGSGFALYLNIRTVLEGWDVELAFRRLANRLAAGASVLFVGILLCSVAPPLHAQEPSVESTFSQDDDRVLDREAVKAIKASDDYSRGKETREIWRPKNFGKTSKPSNMNLSGFEAFGQLVVYFMYALVALVIGLVIFFIVKALSKVSIGSITSESVRLDDGPVSKIQELLAQEKLPDDIPGEAEKAWAAGAYRHAMSLLYRGALLRLSERGTINIADCATEMEVLDQVKTACDNEFTVFFRKLTSSWQQIAWAHRQIPGEVFSELLRSWRGSLEVIV